MHIINFWLSVWIHHSPLCGITDSLGFLLMFPKYKCKPWYYSEKKSTKHGVEEA